MNPQQLKQKILTLRHTIRKHRDQKGDDRCWVDDYWLYEHVPNLRLRLPKKISYEEGMKRCKAFYTNRKTPGTFTKIPEEKVTKNHDEDLETMTPTQLRTEYERIIKAITKHAQTPLLQKTIKEDKELYFILPEKKPANFRLPPKEAFIEGKKEGCGCPNFWKSHTNCQKKHDYHSWGPCT